MNWCLKGKNFPEIIMLAATMQHFFFRSLCVQNWTLNESAKASVTPKWEVLKASQRAKRESLTLGIWEYSSS
jgi:hypothetical protein